MGRPWQRLWIGLARSHLLLQTLQHRPGLNAMARRFVAGSSVEEAWQSLAPWREEGFRFSLYYLGEYVSDEGSVAVNANHIAGAADLLVGVSSDAHVSVDPTQIGYHISPSMGWTNARRIGQVLLADGKATLRTFMLDMEDRSWVDDTLRLHAQLRVQHVPVGITVQAYLHRSERDVRELVRAGNTAIRLVKGAFAESPQWAWRDRKSVRDSYLRLAGLLLSAQARENGIRPVFGTHDPKLAEAVAAIASARGWPRGSWEFEMLFGVCAPLQQSLRQAGHAVRLYVPFGTEWWPYVARRIGENPRNALLIARSLRSPASRCV